jgi:hypothetical protein
LGLPSSAAPLKGGGNHRLRGAHQNQNVASSARTMAKNAKALGLKMAARSSEVGCDTPQRSHPHCARLHRRGAVAASEPNQNNPRLAPKPIRDSHQDQPNQRHDGRLDNCCAQQRARSRHSANMATLRTGADLRATAFAPQSQNHGRFFPRAPFYREQFADALIPATALTHARAAGLIPHLRFGVLSCQPMATCHRSSNSRSLRLLILPNARILRAFVFSVT